MGAEVTNMTVNTSFNGEYNVVIEHVDVKATHQITPVIEDGVKWETDRQGSPSKLTFKVYNDKNPDLNFQEGDKVTLQYRSTSNDEWTEVFTGHVFTKKRNKSGWIDVTAYDALRYFKNKDTYTYINKRASDVLRMIADDYGLATGEIEDTNYIIGERVEDNQSLFDIVQNALDLTLIGSGTKYILYTDNGRLCLKDAHNLKTDIVINDMTAKDFDYTSSIDEETYTEIELYYDNDQTNRREIYNAADTVNTSKWGRLRYVESVQDTTNIQNRTTTLLNLYNRKTRTMKVSEAYGDIRCRAGASVIVMLDLGDLKVSNYMLIEKATHTFKKNEYRMDLTLAGFKDDETASNVIYTEANVVDIPINNTGSGSSGGSSGGNGSTPEETPERIDHTEVMNGNLVKLKIIQKDKLGIAGTTTLNYYNEFGRRRDLTPKKGDYEVWHKKGEPITLYVQTPMKNGEKYRYEATIYAYDREYKSYYYRSDSKYQVPNNTSVYAMKIYDPVMIVVEYYK